MIQRGSLYWADLGPASGSAPAKRRPVLVVQGNHYNESRIATVLVAVVTSNTGLAEVPGNVFLPATASGLPEDSAINLSQLITIDKSILHDYAGDLPSYLLLEVNDGLRSVLAV